MHKIPFTPHVDPTKYKFEHEYCCGTLCDKFKVAQQFKHLQEKLAAIQEVIDEYENSTHPCPASIVGQITEILNPSKP